jgi:ABC-2 type transport system ATP-binding protein
MHKALYIKGLKKVYKNGTEALKGVDLEVVEGDFFALLGPNGAGKTTLISIASGLTNKSEGDVKIFGKSIDDEPEAAKSHIGVVPQEFNFGIFEPVENIILDQAGYYGIPRAAAKPQAEKYMKALGLWEKRKDKAITLSGGMKRRLMIARALVHEPKLLILDEPTAGVDIELRRSMWNFLKGLTREGRTIILTTHYLEEAEQLAKHIAIINRGEIVESGSLKELLSKLHTESFILDLNQKISDNDLRMLSQFEVKKLDQDSIEVSLNKEQSLNQVILALNEKSLQVKSMRNKSNRLEELFLDITKK